jgi:hypothetical protein
VGSTAILTTENGDSWVARYLSMGSHSLYTLLAAMLSLSEKSIFVDKISSSGGVHESGKAASSSYANVFGVREQRCAGGLSPMLAPAKSLSTSKNPACLSITPGTHGCDVCCPPRHVTVRLAARSDGGPTDPQGAATDAVQSTCDLQLITMSNLRGTSCRTSQVSVHA